MTFHKIGGERFVEKNLELSSLIHGQFPNQSAFAERIGWRRQKLNKIVNGDKIPSLDDVQTIADGLGVPFMMVAKFYLHKKSPID